MAFARPPAETNAAAQPESTAARPESVLSVGIAVALTAVILYGALTLGLGGFTAFMFGGPIGLLMVGLVFVGTVVLISTVAGFGAGRRRIGAAVCVTALAFVALVTAVFGFGTVPMIWVQPGFDLATLMIAVLCALFLGVFFRSWQSRIAGVIGCAALVAGAVWVTVPEPEPTGPSQAELQSNANFEAYIANGQFPLIADLPGGSLVEVSLNSGPPHTFTETADGGLVEVVIDRQPLVATNPETVPCRYIVDVTAGVVIEETDTLQDYSSWCVFDQGIWRLVNGTGYARMDNGSVITVTSASSAHIRADNGQRPATPDEVFSAWNSVRPMTEIEVREHRDVW
ncbi:hypothetical protein B0I08_10450 [Glaciihabitans tibetensis]|uniref:Uncharacterized protein n=1 Tax=Glaciihabitans tibetensis TaxID=1266600 RepID=A0A2T0VDV9_9MICO|nr:hypothetical protein B0I08_10450 [Glaciihabitans tibetensis]